MAYSVELVGRRLTKGQNPQGLLKYQVWAADNETIDQSVAYGLVHAASPTIFEGLVKQNVNVEELSDEIYSGDVQYGVLSKGEAGDDPGWSFEIGGATQHITHSLETVASYAPPGKTAPDHKGAIGVRRTGNGGLSVDGVDIDVDTFTWEETHYFPLAAITPACPCPPPAHDCEANCERAAIGCGWPTTSPPTTTSSPTTTLSPTTTGAPTTTDEPTTTSSTTTSTSTSTSTTTTTTPPPEDCYIACDDESSYSGWWQCLSEIDDVEVGMGPAPRTSAAHYIQAGPQNILWQKERLWNLVESRLPTEFDNVAFVDADVVFDDPDWAEKADRALRSAVALQPFGRCHAGRGSQESACKAFLKRRRGRGAPGFAWAVRRDWLREIGGLYDRHIAGGGDAVFASAVLGIEWGPTFRQVSPAQFLHAKQYVRKANPHGKATWVRGAIRHLNHGTVRARHYADRNHATIAASFDPEADVTIDEHGLLAWAHEDAFLQRAIEGYFRKRDDDSDQA